MSKDIINKYKLPLIVSVLNRKGGSGKTTLATNIATKLHLDQNKVLLVDSDTQRSARDWHAAGKSDLKVIGIEKPTLGKDLRKISEDFDWVIIDGVPNLKEMAVASIKCSDLIIIPIQPSGLDIWAANDLVDLIKEHWQLEGVRKPLAYFCVTRKIANSNLAKDIGGALEDSNIPCMASSTTSRADYIGSVSQGKTVFDTNNNQAKEEITNIVNEIKQILT